MKRFFSILLTLALLLSLVSCGEEVPFTNETKEILSETGEDWWKEEILSETETKDTSNYAKVPSPLKPEDLEAIPIAREGMTEAELRQICVDFFLLSVSFPYVPNQQYDYTVASQHLSRTLEEGKIYGGLPYITDGGANLYRILDHYDSKTGILDMTAFQESQLLFGNACSGGAAWGWARVVNSVKGHQYTVGMCHANGYLKLGPYEYDTSMLSLSSPDALEICKANGEQVMYESYAQAQPADGIVNTGHVRMVTGEPIIARKDDGTIDGRNSFLICTDQICYNSSPQYTVTQEDGSTYQSAGGRNLKYSFASLYSTGYIPFTFAEFQGTDPIEEHGCKVILSSGNEANGAIPLRKLATAMITSNYMVSDVYFTVRNAKGNKIFSTIKHGNTFRSSTWSLATTFPLEKIEKFVNGKNTIEIQCRIGNGELISVYNEVLKP